MEQQAPGEQAKPMSFFDRLTSIFASPGELFDNVRMTGPTHSNWVLPWLVFCIIGVLMGQLIISNPSLADQLGATIKKSFQENVEKGQMTQEQADATYERFAKPGSAMFTVFQVGGVTLGSLIFLFIIALVYWFVGKTAMGAAAPYMKVVEVLGLTFFIGALEQIVSTILMISMDSIYATPSLALFVADFDIADKLHVTLSKVNVFTFWSLSAVSIGLSRLFQRDLPKVMVLVFTLWVLWTAFSVITGFRVTG